jgi:hypothetical protein
VQAASDILHTAANLLPERAGELPSVIHSAFGETDLALGSLVTLLGAGATRDSRTGVLMAQHAERQNNTDSDSAQLARELYMIVLGLSAPSPAAAAADPLKARHPNRRAQSARFDGMPLSPLRPRGLGAGRSTFTGCRRL